jgi:hypothetical protein
MTRQQAYQQTMLVVDIMSNLSYEQYQSILRYLNEYIKNANEGMKNLLQKNDIGIWEEALKEVDKKIADIINNPNNLNNPKRNDIDNDFRMQLVHRFLRSFLYKEKHTHLRETGILPEE